MQKQIFMVIVVLLAVLAVVAYFTQRSSVEKKDSVSNTQKMDVKTAEVSIPTQLTQSRYVEYSKEILTTSKNTRRVLFFYANWCPTCKPANDSFLQNAESIPEDVTLIRVNYNDTDTDQEEKELAKLYGVTYQHTFVQIDEQDKEVTKWNGGKIEELLQNVR